MYSSNISKILVKVSFVGILTALLIISTMVFVLSQANGIEINPSYSREVTSGQEIVYTHTLSNNTSITDTFIVEVYSTQGWNVALFSKDHLTATLQLPLNVDAHGTAPFQMQLSVPQQSIGITEITVITATSQISPTVLDTVFDTTIVVPHKVYLPIVFKRWPPIPYPPTFELIQGADDGSFIVSWNEQPEHLSDYYTLQEAKDSLFTNELRNVCITSQQFCNVDSKVAGTYYYRVRGTNSWGNGEWSNVIFASVLLPDTPAIYGIDNSDGDGSYTVYWSTTLRTVNYTLQEDVSASFSNPTTYSDLTQNAKGFSGKASGTYYYRVLANGPTGISAWSATQAAYVPPPPETPTINPIENADGDGSYTILWNATARATDYTLQEDTSSSFSNPTTFENITQTSKVFSGKVPGIYYYRVQADGPSGKSAWSGIKDVTVLPPVRVLNNHTTYPSTSGSFRYVTGEIINNTASYLRFVKISVNFFNNSQLVATDYTYTYLDDIHPGEKTCFQILLLTNPPTWTHYTFEPVSYWTDGSARPNLSVTSHSGSIYFTSFYRIIGQIQNNESGPISYANAVTTLYNSNGDVLDCDYGYVNSDTLNPGQSSSFEILAMPVSPSQVATYILQTDGSR